MMSSYNSQQEWVSPSATTMAPGPEGALEIIDRWIPFNKRESSIMHMHDLYPPHLQVSMAACVVQYSISFPGYVDRETFERIAENEILILNHDFY